MKDNLRKQYFLILSVFAMLSIIAACGETEIGELDFELDEERPLTTSLGMKTLFSQNSVVRLKMEAPVQHTFANRDEAYPEGLYLEIYDSLGVKTTTLVADSGYHDYSENSYRVVGNVEVQNLEKTQKLETEVLNWDKVTKEIYTDTLTPVKITNQAEIVNGNGLRAKQDFSEYDITGGITGIVSLN